MRVLLVASLLFACSAHALPPNWNTVGQYSQVRDDERVKIYLAAAGGAYVAANAALEVRGKAKLFCQPGSLTMNPENYISIFERYLGENHFTDGKSLTPIPIETVLLHALQSTFPCS